MPEDHIERRRDLRIEVHMDALHVLVLVHGIEATAGVVLNVSRGGMKVRLEHEIPEPLIAHDCVVFFVEDRQGLVSETVNLVDLVGLAIP